MSSNLKAFINVNLSFLPLILFWSISGKLGLILGFASAIVVLIRNIINKNIGIMTTVLVVYYTVSCILYFNFNMELVIQYKYLSSYTVLALTGLISIIKGKPYTMYEAKSGYREEFGSSPLFIEVNVAITKIWTLIYIANAAIELIGHNSVTIVVMNIFVIVGIAFSIMISGALPEV